MGRKILISVLSLIFICSSMFCINAFAQSIQSKDGLTATLTTDKNEYNTGDEINLNLKVENNNSFDISNIQTEITIPSGLSISDGTSPTKTFSLKANSSDASKMTIEANKTSGTSETGDNSNTLIWLIVALVSLIALVCISLKSGKHKGKNFALVLLVLGTFSITSPVIFASANSVNNTVTSSFTVDKTIKLNGVEKTILAKITYDKENSNNSEDTPDNLAVISFESNGGSEVEDIYIEKGNSLGFAPLTSLYGNNFENWYKDAQLTEIFDVTEKIDSDIKLYAKYTEEEIDETFYEETEMYLQNQANNLKIVVQSNKTITSSNLSNFITFSAMSGEIPNLTVSANGNYYTITANGGYMDGVQYEALLTKGVTLVSPTSKGYNTSVITQLRYRIAKEEIQNVEYQDGIQNINKEDLILFDYANKTATIDPTKLLNLQKVTDITELIDKDSIIFIQDTIEDKGDENKSYYVKVNQLQESLDANGNKCYIVYFKDADTTDVYKNVDIFFQDKESELTLDVDEEKIAQEIAESDGVRQFTGLLVAALMESETVAKLGDGSSPFNITNSTNINTTNIQTLLSKGLDTNFNSLQNVATDFSQNAIVNGLDVAVDGLMEGLTVTFKLGPAVNNNFTGVTDKWYGAEVILTYAAELGNHVKMKASMNVTQYINFTANGYCKGGIFSDVEFDVSANIYTQTDMGFTVLVCSAKNGNSNQSQKDPWSDAEKSEEDSEMVDITAELNGVFSGEKEVNNNTIVAQMMYMLESEGDYITLFDKPIFKAKVNAQVIDVNFYANLVLKFNFAAGISAQYSKLDAQQIGIYGSEAQNILKKYENSLNGDDRFSFNLSACGYLGIRAGISGEVTVSFPFLENLGEVGLGVELGAYVDIYGYVQYSLYNKTGVRKDTVSEVVGGIYFETGIYLDVYIFARSRVFGEEEKWTFFEKTWPLYSLGNKEVYLGVDDVANANVNNTVIIQGKNTNFLDCMPTYYGSYLDITTGELNSKPLSPYNIDISGINSEYLKYTYYINSSTNKAERGFSFHNPSASDTVKTVKTTATVTCNTGALVSNNRQPEIGQIEIIWVSDDFEGEIENVGKPCTATFVLKTDNGDITLGTRNVIGGEYVGFFDAYAYASEELNLKYPLKSRSFYNYETYQTDYEYEYTWDKEPEDTVITQDTTFTITAPKRQSALTYVYYNGSNWAVDRYYVNSGEEVPFKLQEGESYNFENMEIMYCLDNSSKYVTDHKELEPVKTAEGYLGDYIYGHELGAENCGTYGTKEEAIKNAKAYLSWTTADSNGFTFSGYNNDAYAIYVANYDIDTSTVTYITNGRTYQQEINYGHYPNSSRYAYSINSYQTFIGWDSNGDDIADYTADSNGQFSLPVVKDDVTYTAIYKMNTYTLDIQDENCNTIKTYDIEYLSKLPDEVLTYIENYRKKDGETLTDGGYAYDFRWNYAFNGELYTDKDYYFYMKDNFTSYITGNSMLSQKNFTVKPWYTTYYEMVINMGDGSFDENEIQSAIGKLDSNYYKEAKLNDDGTISVLVQNEWTLEPNYFVKALVKPEETNENSYQLSHWVDQDGNKYEFNGAFPKATKGITFTPVYKAVEKEYTVVICTMDNGYVDTSLTEEFTGNYAEYLEFIENNTTKYEANNRDTAQFTFAYDGYEVAKDGEFINTIYQNWTKKLNSYSVTYIDDVSSGSEVITADYNKTIITKDMQDVVQTDYTSEFMGWDSDGDGIVDYEILDNLKVTGDVTLTAVWKQTCTIEFIGANFETLALYKGVVGENFTETIPSVDDLESQAFTGWDIAIPTKFEKNLTLTAQFELKTYTLTMELTTDGVKTTDTMKVTHFDKISELTLPDLTVQASGKILENWGMSGYSDSDFKKHQITSDLTITASITSVYVIYMKGNEEYSKTAVNIGNEIAVLDTLIGYDAWLTNDVTITNGKFTMPSENVTFNTNANLTGTFSISDGINTNIYDANTYKQSVDNVDISSYIFDTTNGIIWINSNNLTISGEASDITIIVGYEVTNLTLKDLTIVNKTKKDYEIPDFPWPGGETIDVDPINNFIVYAYGLEFTLNINGNVNLTKQNANSEINGGDQSVVYYSALQQGTYKWLDESLINSDFSNIDECYVNKEGWVTAEGKFIMQGSNNATFNCNSIGSGIHTSGETIISDIAFNLITRFDGMRISPNWDSNYQDIYNNGTLEMTNCEINGSESESGCKVIISFGDATFTNCTYDDGIEENILTNAG